MGKYYIYHLLIFALMLREKISKAEVKILRLFPRSQTTVSQIAGLLDIDISWASKGISNLAKLGLLEVEKKGREKYVSVPDSPLGTALASLMMEEPALRLDAVLGGPSLQVLPLLISPGHSTREVAERTGISIRTIQYRIKRWRGMGTVIYENNKYKISQRRPLIIDLMTEYSKHRNICHLKDKYPDAAIIWQDRDEYVISLEREISDNNYCIAGATKIGYLGYDIISRNYYYYYSPMSVRISEAEALVQTVKFDMINPRPLRYIRWAIENKKVTKAELREYAKRYRVEKRVEEAL